MTRVGRQQLDVAVVGALTRSWPRTQFVLVGEGNLDLVMCWTRSEHAPSQEAAQAVIGRVLRSLRGETATVRAVPCPSLRDEALNIVRAWRSGDLAQTPAESWTYGRVNDETKHDAERAVLADATPDELSLADAIVELAGLDEAGYMARLMDDDIYRMRQELGRAVLAFGEAVEIASTVTFAGSVGEV